MLYTYSSSTQEAEAAGLPQVQGQPEIEYTTLSHIILFLEILKKSFSCWAVVVRAFNPSTQKAEADGSLSFMSVWSTD